MRFTKLQGTGNDYVFVDGLSVQRDWSELARRVSDRHFGVGSDGLIVAAPSLQAQVRMQMYNADGSEAEMCGNGLRCFAKYVLEGGLVPPNSETLSVETGAGVKSVLPFWSDRRIVGARVDMGEPLLRAAEVPVEPAKLGPSDYAALDAALVESLGLTQSDLLFDAALSVDEATLVGTAVSMGNPHFVAFVEERVTGVSLERLGPLVEGHAAFPARVNLHTAKVMARDRLVVRTWERGSGQTLACGTGVCAVVVAARLHGLVDDAVTVMVPGGELTVTWAGRGPVLMEGDAVEVFSGQWPE